MMIRQRGRMEPNGCDGSCMRTAAAALLAVLALAGCSSGTEPVLAAPAAATPSVAASTT